MSVEVDGLDQIDDLAADLRQLADQADQAGARTVAEVADGTARVQRDLVAVFSGETRDSVRVATDDDRLGATVGPTNRDERGWSIGWLVEHGNSSQDPQPFVGPSARWAEDALAGRTARAVAELVDR